MALTNLPLVKAMCGIPASNSAQDTALTAWLSGADAAVKSYCHRDLEQTTYPGAAVGGEGDSGYYSGNGSPHLFLRQTPVTSVTAVYVDPTGRFGENPDGAFAGDTLQTYGTDYTLRFDGCLPGTTTKCSYSGILQRMGLAWPAMLLRRSGQLLAQQIPGNGNVKVSYVAGYATIPADLVVAVAQFVAMLRRTAQAGMPLQSESQGAYSYSVATAALGAWPELGSMRQLLAKYRRVDL